MKCSLLFKSLSLKAVMAFVLIASLGLGGCASTSQLVKDARGGPGQRLDPWENWTRKAFAFNEGLDKYFLKPVATGYQKVVPQVVRRGIDNFFSNFADGWSAINNVLQGKPEPAFTDAVRFTFNSTLGIFGLFDWASEFGLDHHYEDFGQTLGRWGFGPGAYIVLPLLGPSTVRDTAALPLDRLASPALLINDGRYQFGIVALQIVNTRANLLGASQVIDDIAIDKYSFIRDAYLQRRRSLVFDGDAPDLPDSNDSAATGTGASPAATSTAATAASQPASSAPAAPPALSVQP